MFNERRSRAGRFLTQVIFIFIFCNIALAAETKPFKYDAKGKRDPFIPIFSGEPKSFNTLESIGAMEDLMLEGILWDPNGNSAAIINGSILKEGEAANNVRILKITPKSVYVVINDKTYELKLQVKEELP